MEFGDDRPGFVVHLLSSMLQDLLRWFLEPVLKFFEIREATYALLGSV